MVIRLITLILAVTLLHPMGQAQPSGRPLNVLFIAVDDLRPELGCYGTPIVRSPHIDTLARQGLRFDRAYCQQAICGPSRTSLMTGLRPDSCRAIHNEVYFRTTVPGVVTLPQHFIAHGYEAVYTGKIYHAGMRDEEKSWSMKAVMPKRLGPAPVGGYALPENQALVKQRREEAKRQYPGMEVWALWPLSWAGAVVLFVVLMHLVKLIGWLHGSYAKVMLVGRFSEAGQASS